MPKLLLNFTSRGFEKVDHLKYPPVEDGQPLARLVQQSSIIGDYPDATFKPGSSGLWVGKDHHLDREEVKELADRLQAWLATGSLRIPSDPKGVEDGEGK